MVASVIGAFYYLRIVYYMYFGSDTGEELDRTEAPILSVFLAASAAAMLLGIVNLFGIEGAAAAAAATLVH